MKVINLKLYLMLLIIFIAGICLFFTAIFVLFQTHSRSWHEMSLSAESIDKQLEVKLVFGRAKGFKSSQLLLDFDYWIKSENSSGLCVQFEQPNGKVVKRACRGAKIIEQWPSWFDTSYRWFFQPGQKIKRPITYHNKIYGYITVFPNVDAELSQAWHDVKTLMKLAIITIISLCTLLYFAMGWVLRPAGVIVNELEKMAEGNLSARLTDFTITEWQRTGQAINHLAENLEKTLSDRNQLAFKLMNAQEQERRYLTRELHDELGQSLAGLAAVASSITQTAEKECPQIVAESQTISRITQHMMALLRDLLLRLRSTDFDELGLAESLQNMVAEWNMRSGGKTRYQIDVVGNVDHLPDVIPITLFRITQECLTNISRHSKAKNASVKLEISDLKESVVILIIKDDGIVDYINSSDFSGMGLLGVRQRVTALGGEFLLKTNQPSGLIVHVQIPLQPIIEPQK